MSSWARKQLWKRALTGARSHRARWAPELAQGWVTVEPGGGVTTVVGALEGGVTTVVFGGGWTVTQPANPSRTRGTISQTSRMDGLHGG